MVMPEVGGLSQFYDVSVLVFELYRPIIESVTVIFTYTVGSCCLAKWLV